MSDLAGILAGAFVSSSGRKFHNGSAEHAELAAQIAKITSAQIAIASIIGGQPVFTGDTNHVRSPHNHELTLAIAHRADAATVTQAIDCALAAAPAWRELDWQERVRPFIRAAQLLEDTSWGIRLVAATMLELSKTKDQAVGDAVCETVDLIKMNIRNFAALLETQPISTDSVSNQTDYRPLEGFVFAISPFNFTSMSHLAITPALLGNTVVWKPAEDTSLVAFMTMQLLKEAGLPDGVINLVIGSGREIGPVAINHPKLAAVSFTGSTETFNSILETIGSNTRKYLNYPRVVGETGGKAFIAVHPTADIELVVNECIKGAFEYQGQKCSAATRVYLPQSKWQLFKELLEPALSRLSVGDPTNEDSFMGAVINANQFAYHAAVISRAQDESLVIAGGKVSDDNGWFVWPTVIATSNPHSEFMTEEFFGPILSVYVYLDDKWEATLNLIDTSTVFGLAGSIFGSATDAISIALTKLRYTAGNVTVNGKPTGASVGYQPFGGARASGTNDKVGTTAHLLRFLSPRTIKQQH